MELQQYNDQKQLRKIWKWEFGMRADKLQYGQVSSLLPLKVGFFQVQLNFLMLKMSVVDLKWPPTNSACFPPSRIWPGLGSFNEDKVVVVMLCQCWNRGLRSLAVHVFQNPVSPCSYYRGGKILLSSQILLSLAGSTLTDKDKLTREKQTAVY